MSIRIGSNISSLTAQRYLSDSTELLTQTSERLSSGLRINRASDDAAGLAISTSLNADARIFSQAIKNVSDGVSTLSIAQGALSQLTDITIRLKELAEQSANGTFGRSQRDSLQTEADSLVAEYNRITQTTTFNGINVFDADNSFLLQVGRGEGTTLDIALSDALSRGVGDGTFYTGNDQTVSGTATVINFADVNDDGKLDLISTGLGNSKVNISLGNGDGTFNAAVSYFGSTGGVNLRQLSVNDMNNDGIEDIVVTTSDGAAVNVLIGNSNGTFRAPVSFAPASNAWGLAVGDINGDGINDIITGSSASTNISIFIGNGNGTFKARTTILGGGNVNGMTLVDINGDGRLDLAATNQTVGSGLDVFLGNGDGTFAARRSITYGDSFSVHSGDFNRDGIIDLVTDSGNATFTNILIGNGDGSFSLSRISGYAFMRGTQVVDIDGDGYEDIISSAETTSVVSILFGNGDGTFRARRTISTSAATADIAAVDITGDGAIDIFASAQGAGTVYALHANADRTASIGYIYLMTQQGARESLTLLDQIQTRIANETGTIGSALSRLEVAKRNLQTSEVNYREAEGRISSADIAQESAEYSRLQILQNSASAVLGQANLQPQIAINLLGDL